MMTVKLTDLFRATGLVRCMQWLLVCAVVAVQPGMILAEDGWPTRSGPLGNGHVPPAEAVGLPALSGPARIALSRKPGVVLT